MADTYLATMRSDKEKTKNRLFKKKKKGNSLDHFHLMMGHNDTKKSNFISSKITRVYIYIKAKNL
jgi:hypothetical protein